MEERKAISYLALKIDTNIAETGKSLSWKERNSIAGFLILSSPFTGVLLLAKKRGRKEAQSQAIGSQEMKRDKAEVQKSQASLSASQVQSQRRFPLQHNDSQI